MPPWRNRLCTLSIIRFQLVGAQTITRMGLTTYCPLWLQLHCLICIPCGCIKNNTSEIETNRICCSNVCNSITMIYKHNSALVQSHCLQVDIMTATLLKIETNRICCSTVCNSTNSIVY